MGLENAYYNLLFLLQNLTDYPLHYSPVLGKLVPNPKFKNGRKAKLPLRWLSPTVPQLAILIVSIVHLFSLKSAFEQETGNDLKVVMQVTTYTFTVVGLGLALVTWYTLLVKHPAMCLMYNDLDLKFGREHVGWPNLGRIPDLEEIIGYIFGFIFFACSPIFLGVIGLVMGSNPVDKMLLPFLSNPLRKIVASLMTAGVAFCGIIPIGFQILDCVGFTLRMTELARHNLEASREMRCDGGKLEMRKLQSSLGKRYDKLVKFLVGCMGGAEKVGEIDVEAIWANRSVERSPIRSTSEVFADRFHLHKEICLLADIGNQIFGLSLPFGQAMAMVLCILFNSFVIALADRVEVPVVSVIFAILISITVTAINLLLLNYASQLSILTRKTIHFWGGVKLGPLEKREMKAMSVASLSMGPFFKIKRESALDVLMTILEGTIDLVCM